MTNLLVDTHTHIYDPVFDKDRDAVLDAAAQAGVGAVIAVSETLDDAVRILELAEKHALVHPAAGLYPTFLDTEQAEKMAAFIRDHRSVLVAIGEVGLDYWKVTEPPDKALQREIFARFIQLSKELDLPLNVHSRSAGRHAVNLLLEAGAAKVQLHAFDGKAAAALPAVEAGYFFSVPPSVVRSRQKQKLCKRLPLDCLLVETDSPVLGPEPGTRNEPANLTMVIHAIAEMKGLHPQEVAEQVAENTRRLYGDLVNTANRHLSR
jgi:TatD DNase family protein